MRFFGPNPALMVVEPESLCWMTGRMAGARDGLTWAGEFARLPALRAVVRDDGTGLGKGVRLDNARRREAGLPEFDQTLDVFHTLREGGRALRKTWGVATRALERAEAAQVGLDRRGRQGRSRQGHGTTTNRLWREAERLWDQAEAAETAWKQAKSAFEFFTPEGRFNDRAEAAAVVEAALPHLGGAAWAKTRRLLLRPESFTFLDQVQERLAGLGLDPDVLSALLDLEGLRRQPGRSVVGDTSLGVGSHGAAEQVVPGLGGASGAGPGGAPRRLAGQQPGGVRQQRGADAAGATSEDDAGIAGPEAAVLEPEAVPHRPPQGPDAVWPAWSEGPRDEFRGVPQADPG